MQHSRTSEIRNNRGIQGFSLFLWYSSSWQKVSQIAKAIIATRQRQSQAQKGFMQNMAPADPYSLGNENMGAFREAPEDNQR